MVLYQNVRADIPYGMSFEIIKTSFLESIIENFNRSENVTSWLYKNKSVGKRYIFKNKYYPILSNLKLSIDSKDD